MPGPSHLLKMWLGAMYQAQVLKRGSYEEARSVVHERLGADESLRAEAETTRDSLRRVVKARPHSHIEMKMLEYLDDALAKETTNGG